MNTSEFLPQHALARTSLYRKQQGINGAEFMPCGEGAVVSRFHSDSSIKKQFSRCALTDLTALARTGFRGQNAAAHLSSAGFSIAEKPNQFSTGPQGELVLRLSLREFWVLGGLADQGQSISALNAAPRPDSACYPLFCRDSHGWLLLSGEHCAAVMAKLCGVDLRSSAFPPGSIAQTSVARINAIIVSHGVNGVPAFSLLCDIGYLPYLWDVLLDAMDEFGGKPVGYADLM